MESLESKTRDELNVIAAERGVEDPTSYRTKSDLIQAIESVVPNSEDQEAVDEAIEGSQETAQENAEEEAQEEPATGAERDGTAKVERRQNPLTERQKILREGRETARINLEKEAADQPTGE